jgi:phage recombination protein Bet
MNAVPPKSTAVATTQPRSVLLNMSERYGMEPAAFEATVRATCMPPDKNGRVPSKEEFAAFLLVAKEYSLNPITKEIYAFSGKGGGIVPIVSIDGWANLINSHGELDGMKFDMQHDDNGNLVACTCTIWRKDRTHPIEITEYLSECVRATEPWKMKHRMLRHKSLIQCARYAFGFAGIYDEDEGERIVEAQRVEPPKPPRPTDKTPPKPNGAPAEPKQPPKPANDQSELAGKDIEDAQVEDMSFVDPETGEVVEEQGEPNFDPSDMLTKLEERLGGAAGALDVEETWNDMDLEATFSVLPDASDWIGMAKKIKERFLKNLKNAKGGR